MHNFQNNLQNLEMGSYQVGELTPISNSEDPRLFGGFGIGTSFGGFHRCGGFNCFRCFNCFNCFHNCFHNCFRCHSCFRCWG